MHQQQETTIISTGQDKLPAARDAAALLEEILLDYSRRDTSQPLQDWLSTTVMARTGWERSAASEWVQNIADYVGDSRQLYTDLRLHREQGKSRSSWIARQVESIAQDTGAMAADVVHLQAALSNKTPDTTLKASPAWNDVSRIALAKGVETASIEAAAHAVLEDGARQLARDAAQGLLQTHPEAGRLARNFIQGRLEEEAAYGFQTALATAAGIAASRGALGQDLKSALKSGEIIPAWFAHQAFIGTENARLLHLAGAGMVDPGVAIDRMADVATAAATRATKEVCRRLGGKIGTTVVASIPVVGAFLAPIGGKLGEFLGGIVGEIAGSAIGRVIKKGAEVVKTVARKVVSGVKAVAKGAFNVLTLGIFA